MFFLAFTPAKVVLYQNIHSSNLVGFLTSIQKFSSFSNKFEVRVLAQHFVTIGFGFSVLVFYNGIQAFARFTKYQIKNH